MGVAAAEPAQEVGREPQVAGELPHAVDEDRRITDGDEPPGRELRRPYFDAYRHVLEEETGPFVEFRPTYGDWVRLFRASGLAIEDLIELRPVADADTTFTDYAPLDWARDFPGEQIWKLRKESV